MKTPEEKKVIALALIAPYYKDPSTCGYDGEHCVYETVDGRMCVAGKCMLPSVRARYRGENESIIGILLEPQSIVFLPEYVDVFSHLEWNKLQLIHDWIAKGNSSEIIVNIERLGLFALPELEEYCKTLTA